MPVDYTREFDPTALLQALGYEADFDTPAKARARAAALRGDPGNYGQESAAGMGGMMLRGPTAQKVSNALYSSGERGQKAYADQVDSETQSGREARRTALGLSMANIKDKRAAEAQAADDARAEKHWQADYGLRAASERRQAANAGNNRFDYKQDKLGNWWKVDTHGQVDPTRVDVKAGGPSAPVMLNGIEVTPPAAKDRPGVETNFQKTLGALTRARQMDQTFKSGLKNTLGAGPFRIPNESTRRYESLANLMSSDVTSMTRVPGEGSQSDFEARMKMMAVPFLSDPDSQYGIGRTEKQVEEQIRATSAQLRDRAEMLGAQLGIDPDEIEKILQERVLKEAEVAGGGASGSFGDDGQNMGTF